MDDLKKFRKFLGSVADDYDDFTLAKLQHDMQAMAELLLDIYLDERSRESSNDRLDDQL